jgi:hypothetical protein
MREVNNRMYAYTFSAAFAILCLASPANASPFDGHWNMVVVTTSGHCGKIKVGLAISSGRIAATSGSFAFHRIRIDGLISGAGGRTRMTAVAGPRVAKGSGRFIRSQGQGKWSGTRPSGVCSGIRRSLLTPWSGSPHVGWISFRACEMDAAAMSTIPRLPDTFRWRLAIGAVLIAGSYLAWLIIPLVVSSGLSPEAKTALTALLGATPLAT